MKKPLLMTALKNRFKKVGNYEYYLKNININGVKRGCDGFIRNPENGKIVYLTTEYVCGNCYKPLANKMMYRTAKDLKDFSGGENQWCVESELVDKVVKALT